MTNRNTLILGFGIVVVFFVVAYIVKWQTTQWAPLEIGAVSVPFSATADEGLLHHSHAPSSESAYPLRHRGESLGCGWQTASLVFADKEFHVWQLTMENVPICELIAVAIDSGSERDVLLVARFAPTPAKYQLHVNRRLAGWKTKELDEPEGRKLANVPNREITYLLRFSDDGLKSKTILYDQGLDEALAFVGKDDAVELVPLK